MKELLSLFKDIKVHKAIILCIAALSILLPGILFIFQFKPALFTADILKLQLFAAAFSFGFVLLLFIIFILYFLEIQNKQLVVTENTIWLALLFASVFCSAELFIISFIKMWVGNGLKASWAITICLIVNFILIIDSIKDYKGRVKKLNTVN